MQKRLFDFSVKFSDLLILARVVSLTNRHGRKPSVSLLNEELESSRGEISGAFSRIAEAFGPVEVPGKERRTMVPSLRGRTIAAAAVLFELLIKIVQDPQTDFERMRMRIEDLTRDTHRDYLKDQFRNPAEEAGYRTGETAGQN